MSRPVHLSRSTRRARRSEPLPIFVYGPFRSELGGLARLLGNAPTRVERAELAGALLLDSQQYPYAVLTGGLRDVVTGELVTVAPESTVATLDRLDRAFGYSAQRRRPRWQRRVVTVRIGSRQQDAWVYVAADWLAPRLTAFLPRVHGGDWVQHVTSTWLALHQSGRRGVGRYDGHGMSWSTFDQTRGDVAPVVFPAAAIEDAFADPTGCFLDPATRGQHHRRAARLRARALTP